jgi:hypothetical protein
VKYIITVSMTGRPLLNSRARVSQIGFSAGRRHGQSPRHSKQVDRAGSQRYVFILVRDSRSGRSSTLAYAVASRRKTVLDVRHRLPGRKSHSNLQVYGRLRVIAGLHQSNDQILIPKLTELQTNSVAKLRASYEAQAAIEQAEDEGPDQRKSQ